MIPKHVIYQLEKMLKNLLFWAHITDKIASTFSRCYLVYYTFSTRTNDEQTDFD